MNWHACGNLRCYDDCDGCEYENYDDELNDELDDLMAPTLAEQAEEWEEILRFVLHGVNEKINKPTGV